ncbi:hypothetical protein ACFT9I_19160 [Streptomyces sp. NPDC057137]
MTVVGKRAEDGPPVDLAGTHARPSAARHTTGIEAVPSACG